ncbi:ESX secretion-associated protein EspG [Nocardia transvalensis]|uniref:ESX secretion-associated protein EspG n=1 Tax=Nocardia transvalensis TaxID=37333 RepID=UPI00189627AC|nr:ESX secretion-associated protein EspG [Nocardia transvalensis]MBF6327228.1 ESX secretion-associated protein EspG [Nocardia transvalensis]
MRWTLTPDQFALAWERTDGDRIPYPLAVRLTARTSDERAAQLPDLNEWCSRTLDPDLESALRVLARPTIRVEVFGEHGPRAEVRPVRVLGACAGHVTVVAAQRAGSGPDRGAEVRLFVGNSKSFAARIVSVLPENGPGSMARHTAPLDRVREDSRDLVTVPVSGPSVPARMRRLLKQPRDGIGQIVVSARRADDTVRPLAVLCWIDIAGDGRYTVRTRTEVDIVPVTAEAFTAQLRPLITAAERLVSDTDHW